MGEIGERKSGRLGFRPWKREEEDFTGKRKNVGEGRGRGNRGGRGSCQRGRRGEGGGVVRQGEGARDGGCWRRGWLEAC